MQRRLIEDLNYPGFNNISKLLLNAKYKIGGI